MKSKLLALVIVLAISAPFYPRTRAEEIDTLVFNELMPNPTGSEVEGEWVELFNAGDDVNVKDWMFTDSDGATFTFPELVVPSQSFVLVYVRTGDITYQPNTIILYMNRTWSMLNNGGDDLFLQDSGGNAVDYVNYGSGSAVDYPPPSLNWSGTNKTVEEGFSYALMPDGEDRDSDENWEQALPSPGALNSVDEGHDVLITEVYYNANRDNEYFKLYNPSGEALNLSGWSLTDLEGTIIFKDGSAIDAKSEIIIAENSTSFYEDTLHVADYRFSSGDATPMIVGGVFKLKNDGDELLLKNRAGKVIDVFTYGLSNYTGEGWFGPRVDVLSKGKIAKRTLLAGEYVDTNTSMDWDSQREYGIGQSSFQVKTFQEFTNVTVFTAPDSSYDVITGAIDDAMTVIHISLYEFTNWYLAQHLLDALERGVEVKILFEGAPVQGIINEQRYIMKALAEQGCQIRLMINDPDAHVYERYRYLHAKYVVIDDDISIVSSENWGSTGVPKNNSYGNRGWGIVIESKLLAGELLEVFDDDSNPLRRDIVNYAYDDYPIPPGYVHDTVVPTDNYEAPFERLELGGYIPVTPVLSPDTSMDEQTIIGMIRSAQTSIMVQQFYIVEQWKDGNINPYLEEVVEAARRGVEVKVLLDDSEYNVDPEEIDNDDLVKSLNELGASEGLNLEARLFNSSAHGIVKVHNKGMIVDDVKVLVSSINWNQNSMTKNREMGLIIKNEAIGEYLKKIFLYDWKDDVKPPIARGCLDKRIKIGEEIIFDGTKSYDANPLTYQWDLDGDGTVDATLSTSKFRYENPGSYRAVLNVSDPSGNYNVSTCLIEVVAEDPYRPSNVLTWTFYSILISITILIIYLARRMGRRNVKPPDEQ